MLNLLLVEDDEFFRQALADSLREQGWKVTASPDGRTAKEQIKVSQPFDAIISDIQMPHFTGVELLEWVKQNKPMPFVLMTGFALIMETKKAHELGADDFLSKPFEIEELVKIIKNLCAKKLGREAANAADNDGRDVYCKVSLEDFVASKTLNFDVYVMLGVRYLKIGRRGDVIPVERIKNYADKGLKHLFVKKEDFRNLVSFNLDVARVITKSNNVDPVKKANFMRYTGEVVLEKAFIAGMDRESFDEAKSFLSTSMEILADDPLVTNLLLNFNEYADFVYAHSMCVSVYSILIARKMAWTSTANLFKLSLAGIFHDIGKKEIERELLERPRALLTHAERKIIESHAARGREILMTIKQIPEEAVEVAYQHHENTINTGYPRGLGKAEIHPYANIVHVANLFAEFAVKSPTHPNPMTPEKAVAHMQVHYGESMAPQVFAALIAVACPNKHL